jgi:uncharacterized protein YajQ (UPF0234 family)
MATASSFDISTGADLQEVDNAVNQALKEVQQRYDFKGTHCTIEFDRAKAEIRLAADDDFRMKSLLDVLQTRLIKRGVPIKNMKTGDFEAATGSSVRCTVTLTKAIKDNKAFKKVSASIQGDEIRVSSPSRDELQAVMAFLRGGDFEIELTFGNYRG